MREADETLTLDKVRTSCEHTANVLLGFGMKHLTVRENGEMRKSR
jgi:hypothetical protein